MKPLIFISSVSRELRTARQLVANTLHALGYEPVWQDIFETSPDDLREMLRKKIDSCSAVLQIVGHAYGAEPPTPDATFGRCSYTQYEALYARSRKKPVYYLIAQTELPRDAAAETIDTPCDESDAAMADAAERLRLQWGYRQKVLTTEQEWYPIHTPQETELSVRRLRDDLSKLQRGFRNRKVGIKGSLVLIVGGIGTALVLMAGGIAWLDLEQNKQVKRIDEAKSVQQELAKTVVDADESIHPAVHELNDPAALAGSICQAIRQTSEKEINALLAQNGPQGLVEVYESHRDRTLGRVDDLIKWIQVSLKEGASPVFQRASDLLQKDGTDEALAYLKRKRTSIVETARRLNGQIKLSLDRVEAEKEERNTTLQSLMLEAELLEIKLQSDPAIALGKQVVELAPDWFQARSFLGKLFGQRHSDREAEQQYRAALALASNPREEVNALNHLAALLKSDYRFSEAELLMRRALAINEQSHGPEHIEVAITLHKLAVLLNDLNRRAEAVSLMRRALAIDEKFYGVEHTHVATRLDYMARLVWAAHGLEKAEPLMRRALAIDEQSYGAEHPHVADRLSFLGVMIEYTNRPTEAVSLMRRAVAIDEQSFGAKHIVVARVLSSLASLLEDAGRLEEAVPLLRRVLAIYEHTYGDDSSGLSFQYYKLAKLLQATNHQAEAEPLLRRAPAIMEQSSWGAEFHAGADDLYNLAKLLQDTNRLVEAELLMRRCRTILHRDQVMYKYEYPSWTTYSEDYRKLLQAMKFSPKEIEQRFKEAEEVTGPLKPIMPEIEKLLGPAKPVAEVFAALDRQYKAEGKPAVYYLKPHEPITPHLDELFGRSLLDVPLSEPITLHLDALIGPVKTTKEVFEDLDRQYREQNKPAVWFLPPSEPISPHLDELLGPMNDPIQVATGDWEAMLQTAPDQLPGLLVTRMTQFAKFGQVTEVAQAGAKLRELAASALNGSTHEEKGGMLYNAACAYGLCAGLVATGKPALSKAELAEQKSFRDLSLACLKAAIAAGWNDFDHMRNDTDLTPLHGLPEFEALFPKKP